MEQPERILRFELPFLPDGELRPMEDEADAAEGSDLSKIYRTRSCEPILANAPAAILEERE